MKNSIFKSDVLTQNTDIQLKCTPANQGSLSGYTYAAVNRTQNTIYIGSIVLFSVKKNKIAETFFHIHKKKNIRMMMFNDSANAPEGLFDNGNRPFFGEPELPSDVKGNSSRLYTILYACTAESESDLTDGLFLASIPSGSGPICCTRFKTDKKNLSAECEVFLSLPAGASVELCTVFHYHGNEIREKLFEYTGFFGIPRKCPDLGKNPGWSTWDYYLWQVSETDILENITEIHNNTKLKNRIKYIVIDDGWQHAYGEWEPNYKFPQGMAATADKIKAAGFIPGIWIGPFMQMLNGQAAANNPEMIIMDKTTHRPVMIDDGFGSSFCFLDPTHPDSVQFLKETFSKIAGWGYQYIKIDFLFFVYHITAHKNGGLYDPGKTPLDALKSGIETIRQTLGDDIILAGCGGFIPEIGTGLFDSCRVSFDISSYWSNILAISRDLALKSFFANRTWENDYDFLITRGKATSSEKKINIYTDMNFFMPESPYEPFTLRKGPGIQTAGEARVWATMVIIAGGALVLADRIKMLNTAGIRIIEKVLQYASGIPGYPLDLFKPGMPNVWSKKEDNGTVLTAFFNWSDADFVFPQSEIKKYIPAANGYEIWSEATVHLSEGITIPARDAVIFSL